MVDLPYEMIRRVVGLVRMRVDLRKPYRSMPILEDSDLRAFMLLRLVSSSVKEAAEDLHRNMLIAFASRIACHLLAHPSSDASSTSLRKTPFVSVDVGARAEDINSLLDQCQSLRGLELVAWGAAVPGTGLQLSRAQGLSHLRLLDFEPALSADFDLGSCTQLRRLELLGKPPQFAPSSVGAWPPIEDLRVDNIRISSEDVTQLCLNRKLRYASFSDACLHRGDAGQLVRGARQLVSLEVVGNYLQGEFFEHLSLATHISLRHLDLSRNRVMDVSGLGLDSNRSLETLVLSWNPLCGLDFHLDSNTTLRSLSLSGLVLHVLGLADFRAFGDELEANRTLEELDLESSFLTDAHVAELRLGRTRGLKRVFLARNELTHACLPAMQLEPHTSIQLLDLRGNAHVAEATAQMYCTERRHVYAGPAL